METKINNELEKVFKSFDDKYYVDGVLNKAKIIEDLTSYNPDLLKTLLDNKYIKNNYSIEINNNTILKVNDLRLLLEMNNYWESSYTKYLNKIGLTSNGRFLSEVSDVVLDFPFKDTILKASMSKEDTDENDLNYDEPFLNEVIAKEEIDVLFDKKILKNLKKYDENGAHEIDVFNNEDNLIIKGNNLLALHSLKEKYAGKVKFIYIDPPYYFSAVRSSDTFSYNSNFKLSSWLIFMKNRLEVARDLLDDDGVIFISISEDGQAYLKVLMDEVFGKNNFVETFIWKNSDNASALGNKSRSGLEYIHAYEKVKNPNKRWIGTESGNEDAPLINVSNKISELKFKEDIIRFNIPDGIYKAGSYPKVELLDDLIVENGRNKNSIRMKGKFKWSQDYLNNEVRNGGDFVIKSKLFSIRYQKSEGKHMAPEKLINHSYLSKAFKVGSYEDSNTHLADLGVDFTFSKPESLIAFLMRATTEEGNIVLDFFMGSGTTQAVSMKMNRRFIGIEQMDYIKSVSVPRLQKVIDGEQGGISKDVNWHGGGSFVYAELMEKNIGFIKSIYNTEKPGDLRNILNHLIDNAEIDFKIDLLELKKTFNELSFDDQKKVLIKVIEKNQLYYNYSEINDDNVRDLVSDSDYEFNRSFYEEDNNE